MVGDRGCSRRRRTGCFSGAALFGALSGLLLLSGCGGSPPPLSGASATPVARVGKPTPVDPCTVVPIDAAARLLETPLHVVGRTVGPAASATLSCQLGRRFGAPLLTVTMVPSPIAKDVFENAFGRRAGGNPQRVVDLGDGAYARSEGTSTTLHVLSNGAVVSITAEAGSFGSDEQASVSELAGLASEAIESLPDNPAPLTESAPTQCDGLDPAVLEGTLGRPPTLSAGLAVDSSALECSWGGQPGAVRLTLLTDPKLVSAYRRTFDVKSMVPVTGVLTDESGAAVSSPTTAGDLVVMLPHDRMLTLQVVPAAGYANPSLGTSDAERAVAGAGLELLHRMAG